MRSLRSATLRDVLAHELERGNTVQDEETAWSRMDLVVRMKDPIDEAYAAQAASQVPDARVYHTSDPHYGTETGVRDGREAVTARAAD